MKILTTLSLYLYVLIGTVATAAPQRIVSTSLASDEILLELLSMEKASDRLAAVSVLADDARYSNVLEAAKAVKHRAGADIEAVLALKPDLVVLASYNKPETIKRYEQAGVRTVVLADFTTLAEIGERIETLAGLAGLAEAGKKLRTRYEADLAAASATKDAPHPQVLSYFADGTVAGKKTLFDEIVRAAGGVNLAATRGLEGWPKLGAEALAAMKPDFLVAGADDSEKDALLAAMRGAPAFRLMPAVAKGKVVTVPPRELAAVSHHVVKAVKRLREAFAK